MDGAADHRVKPDLIKDTLKLLHFEPYDVYYDKINKKNNQPKDNPITQKKQVSKLHVNNNHNN